MKKKKLLLTISLAGIAFLINYLINFFLTSFVSENVGTDAYGFVTLSKTVATYAIIATTALNSYSARYIAIAYHKGEFKKANIYFNSVFFTNLIVGGILLLVCAFLTNWLDVLLRIPSYISKDVVILFVLVFANLFLSLSGTVFQASAIIKNKIMLVSVFKAISYIAEALSLLCIFKFFETHIFYVGIGMIIATSIMVIANFCICKKYTQELKIRLSLYDIKAVGELVFNGIWNSLNALGNTLNSGLDLLVSNMLLSAVAMGQVSIVKTMVNVFNSLYQMVSQPFEPVFLKDYANGTKEVLVKDLKFSMKLSGLLSNLAFAGVVSYGLCYYKLWVPHQDCDLLYKLSIIAIATSIFEGAVYPLYYIYTLTIKNRIPCIITIIGGLLNVLGMYILIRFFSVDIYAVFITTAVIMLTINGISNPIYMTRCLGLPWYTFYPELFRHLMSCIVMTLIMLVISKIINPSTWVMLILAAGISVCLGIIIHIIIVFDISEILSGFKRRLNK